MADGSRVFKNVLVIPPFLSSIPEKMDLSKSFLFNVTKAEPFVPSLWVDVNGDLPTEGEGESRIRKLLDEGRPELLPDVVLEVEDLELVSL